MKTQSYRVVVYLADNTEHKHLQQGNHIDVSSYYFNELMNELLEQ